MYYWYMSRASRRYIGQPNPSAPRDNPPIGMFQYPHSFKFFRKKLSIHMFPAMFVMHLFKCSLCGKLVVSSSLVSSIWNKSKGHNKSVTDHSIFHISSFQTVCRTFISELFFVSKLWMGRGSSLLVICNTM